MHTQVGFPKVVIKYFFVLMLEKSINSHRLVQGGVSFLKVADRE